MGDIAFGPTVGFVRPATLRRSRSATAALRHVDGLLLLSTLGLSGFGLVMIYAATAPSLATRGLDPRLFVDRQITSLAVGLGVMTVLAAVDYRTLTRWAAFAYIGAVALLAATLVAGDEVNASQSWLSVGGLRLQPAELAKPALVLALASLVGERRQPRPGPRVLLGMLLLAGVPMGLIAAQPDLGTLLVFVAVLFGVVLLGGVKVRYIVLLVVLGVLAVGGVVRMGVLEDYQLERVSAFLDPKKAPEAATYNVRQAQIAIGSGQLGGRGLFQGSQTSLSYVPENHTDFIFTVVGEELGFVGAGGTLGAYALLIWRSLRIAALSCDRVGTIIASGVLAVFTFQVAVNVGMAVGLVPVTGLPLPLVSYGGTSLVGSLAMVGLLQSVHLHRFGRRGMTRVSSTLVGGWG
ncbi:MAG: rod shape-determining protein RodA [Actinomycetota bacterium]|nr:rod shape-determining protein RodA [Actinomycetota bacterium]